MTYLNSSLLLAVYFAVTRSDMANKSSVSWTVLVILVGVTIIMATPYFFKGVCAMIPIPIAEYQAFWCGIRTILDIALLFIFSQSLHPARLSPIHIAVEYGIIIPIIVCMNVVRFTPYQLQYLHKLRELGGLHMILLWICSPLERTLQATYGVPTISGSFLVGILCVVYAIDAQPLALKTQVKMVLFTLLVGVAYIKMELTTVVHRESQLHDFYSLRIMTNVDYFQDKLVVNDYTMLIKHVASTLCRVHLLICVSAETSQIRDFLRKQRSRVHPRYFCDTHELTFILMLFLLICAIFSACREHNFSHTLLYTPSTLNRVHSMGLLWTILCSLLFYVIISIYRCTFVPDKS
jgi:hypothetical protein